MAQAGKDKMMGLFKKCVLGSVAVVVGAVMVFAASAPQAVAAEERVSYDRKLMMRAPSTVEDIGIAFLKTANNFPDFSKTIQATEAYKKLDPTAQQDYLNKHISTYQAAYLAYSPRKSDLVLRVKVNAQFKRTADGGATLDIPALTKAPVYFPFQFLNYPVALLIKDIEVFQRINLVKEEADIVYNRLALNGDATLLLQIIPIAADDKKTMTLDNIPQYPLLSEIAYIGLLNRRAEQIWAWENTKYTSGRPQGTTDNRALLDLGPRAPQPVQ